MSSGGGKSNLPPNSVRKHGWSHFSLGRLFGTTSIGRRNIGRHRTAHPTAEGDSHSESSSTGFGTALEGKNPVGFKANYRLASIGHSSLDSESNSLSIGRSESQQDGCIANRAANPGVGNTECPLCLLELPPDCFPDLSSCSHHACYDCLQQYLKIEISESRVNVSCPECTEPIHPNDIRMILNDDTIMNKYESFMLRRVLVTEPDARWCPAPDCGYVVVASGCASCPKLKCERPGCGTYFCYHCKQEWHPNQTCDAARAQRARHSPHPRTSSGAFFTPETLAQRDDIKPCPCCKVLIIKMDDGSCNHMTCSVCGTEFCWLCMKEISDLHYLSPSGCTFWGKKPWSRKKKIMWQLGMLVGAPVGIALIAGIAVPAIIIGIPVWVGRKLHARYQRQSVNKHKRNLVVTGGVLTSILVSPVLAGIAVGIGVPILLAYVYGVVPISLCRSGGCGVTTSASGVRIEFDEETEMNNAAADGASVDTAASHRGANPSIGEVSFGMSTSLSMGSGSHLDRAGVIRDRDSDRESASNTGIAGSIASASLVGPTTHKYGLEVQADVSSNKRFSLSSHSETASATVSLSERSANMSLLDDASTRALAGSLLGCREGTSAVTPVEVHVDARSTSEDVPFSYVALKSLDGQSCGTSCTEEGDEGTAASYCCSEDRSSISSRRGSTRASSRWQARFENGGTLHLASPSSDVESQCSHSTGTAPYRDVCVSFIDESPQSTDNTISLDPSICGDNSTENVADERMSAPEEGAKVVSFRTVPESDDVAAYKRELPRRSTKYESRSLEQLVGYCDLCQKTHRPCCPNAYAHQSCVGSTKLTSNQENLKDAPCCDHGVKKFCPGQSDAGCSASTKDFARAVRTAGGAKRNDCHASDVGALRAKRSGNAAASSLPQVEEPERPCSKKSRPTSAPSSASWRKQDANLDFPTEILICSGLDLRRESV